MWQKNLVPFFYEYFEMFKMNTNMVIEKIALYIVLKIVNVIL